MNEPAVVGTDHARLQKHHARTLEKLHPEWVVVYGEYSREFIGFCLRPDDREGDPVTAGTAEQMGNLLSRRDATAHASREGK